MDNIFTMFKGLGLLGIVAFVVFIVLLGPFLTIWSLNTLFPSLNIQYTWETWVAVVVLGSFYTRLSTKKD